MQRTKPGERRGGRQKGTPNRRTREMEERLSKLGCDPVEGLARLAMDDSLKPELRAKCYSDLLPYVYPRRKAVEFTKESSGVESLTDETAALVGEIVKTFNEGPEVAGTNPKAQTEDVH